MQNIESMFSNHSVIKLKSTKIYMWASNMGKLNNRLLNNPWIKKEITTEITNYVELNENETSKLCRMELGQRLDGDL